MTTGNDLIAFLEELRRIGWIVWLLPLVCCVFLRLTKVMLIPLAYWFAACATYFAAQYILPEVLGWTPVVLLLMAWALFVSILVVTVLARLLSFRARQRA